MTIVPDMLLEEARLIIEPPESVMKKTIVCLAVLSLTSLVIAQAGDVKSSATKKAVSANKAKATSSAKSSCSENTACSTTVQTSAQSACSEKTACCENEKVVTKAAKPDRKGATFLVKR